MADVDAVVVGAGPNGLVAANLLADAGWDVLVLEAKSEPGGAVKTAEVTKPGYGHDLFSAFYPLAAASPVFKDLRLEDHGLVWRHAPLALAHPTPDGRCAVLSRDIDETAASFDTYAEGDGDAWRALFGLWERIGDGFVNAMLRPFPPIAGIARVVGALRPSELMPMARLALLPVRRLAVETFKGAGGGLILAGNALHADLTPETPGSGLFGLILAALGQQVGFPVPEGGAAGITNALVNRMQATGRVELRCDTPVVGISVVNGKATAVQTAQGDVFRVRRAVLADVVAPTLYEHLLPSGPLPARTLDDLNRFEFDSATVKIDWAVEDSGVPWSHPDAARAGTVHLADSMNHLTDVASTLAKKEMPAKPFLLTGQMHVADPTRKPTVWAYTHIPHGHLLDEAALAEFADAVEDVMESHAPGFRKAVLARHVMGPADLERRNPNLVGGAINGGTAQLHQQLFFRHGATARTPIDGLYLASSSAHPGGGVHGGPGANAAIAALSRSRPWRAVAARLR